MAVGRPLNVRNRSTTGPLTAAALEAPLVTVVIPTFNRSAVLRLAIESVLAQKMAHFELLVIGDCCTDDSEQVVAAVEDKRVRWINLEHNVGHQTGPNNEGLHQARGTYIAYLGHDDLWLPDHLEYLCRALSKGSALAFAHQIRIDAGRPPYIWPRQSPLPSRGVRLLGKRQSTVAPWEPGDWMPPTAVAHRIDLARRLGGWRLPDDTNAMEPEADLWTRLAEQGGAPIEVRCITSVKFSAATRKNVYQSLPSDEQERWWGAIREARSGKRLFDRAKTDPLLQTPFCDEADQPPEELWDISTSFEHRHRLRRVFRGLTPGPASSITDEGITDEGITDEGITDEPFPRTNEKPT